MSQPPQILILGAGPTGLGAAHRLAELGHPAWDLLEAAPEPGGLSSSVLDDRGFTWDLGGHVLFSHYEYFDRLMDDLVPEWVEHVRESWVWMRDRYIPYPLQNNIGRLPPDELEACLLGLLEVDRARAHAPRPAHFRDWILQNFGPGLAESFMLPYNRKVWAYDPSTMDVGWMGERVATVDLARILANVAHRRDDRGWGPNHRFRFPLRGGTGSIWRALAARLPAARLHFQRPAVRVDTNAKTVTCADGSSFGYDYLISTIPLDDLLRLLLDEPDLTAQADRLVYSSSHVVGIGLEGPTPEPLKTKNWIYFPEPDLPFYRVTVFSNYSPNNVPDIARYWSLMGEVAESPASPVDASRVVHAVESGLRRAGLIPEGTPVATRWHRRLEHGYPTPFLGRDAVLDPLDAELRRRHIWSRGRFGSWKYEVSNQDHSLMLGVEAVDHLLFGAEETTYRYPSVVNASRGLGRRPLARGGA